MVVMYDITAEQSFTAVRQWLTSVKVREYPVTASHVFHRNTTKYFTIYYYYLFHVFNKRNIWETFLCHWAVLIWLYVMDYSHFLFMWKIYMANTVVSFKSAFSPLPLQEGTGEDITIMLLGNKTDKEIERQVQKGVGERLAKVIFFF